ncbi:MAG: hypothetical protein KG029_12485 [Bacteroidetes bacterium]|nr:hypothetical protein [Bacteroidota bacterium]
MEEKTFVEENLVREISNSLSHASGWMKFLGIVMIIYGVMMALTIVGIIIAWLPIWLGIIVYQAAKNSKTATLTGDKFMLMKSLQNINNYFTISGILLIISILLSVLFVVIVVLTGFAFENLATYLDSM